MGKNVREIFVEKQEYHLEEQGTNHSRTAIIFQTHGHFDRCKYELPALSGSYSLDDWKFLKVVADKILELNPENKTPS